MSKKVAVNVMITDMPPDTFPYITRVEYTGDDLKVTYNDDWVNVTNWGGGKWVPVASIKAYHVTSVIYDPVDSPEKTEELVPV